MGKEQVKNALNVQSEKLKTKFGKLKKLKKKHIVIIAIATVLIITAAAVLTVHRPQKNAGKQQNIITAEMRNIENTVTGSSYVSANNSYDVSSMVTGEVVSDSFNEGDIVTEGQVLYTIDATDAQRSLESTKNSLVKAQMSYEEALADSITNSPALTKAKNSLLSAQETYAETVRTIGSNNNAVTKAANSLTKARTSYEDALEDLENLNIKSEYSGTVSTVYVKNGDNISNGAKIADVYNSKYMKISVPFNSADAQQIYVGQSASVRVAGQDSELYGTVTAVSTAEVSTASHAIVRYVTVEVQNPGALTPSDMAAVTVGGISCRDMGTFEYVSTDTITAKVSGKVYSVNIMANDHVYNGMEVVNMSSDEAATSVANAAIALDEAQMSLEETVAKSGETATNQTLAKAKRTLEEAQFTYNDAVKSINKSLTNAAIELDNAKINLEKAQKTLDDYTITAPIEGTVVTKNIKAGDKLENSGSNSNTSQMAIIYDLSCLTFELSIDESSIHKVQVGQSVTVTADAVEGTFEGIVEKVGVNGTSSNGVTTYPVEIKISEYGELLPGMNVDAKIVVESAENVIAVPVSAVNRGNVVYVKGEKTDEKDHAPDGYKSVKVETGINDLNYIEIKSGINEGDEILGAAVSSGNDTTGTATAEQQQMGGMPGGGMPGGGMPGGMGGGNRNGGGGGMPGGMR